MYKRVISVIFAFLFCFMSAIPAIALETTTVADYEVKTTDEQVTEVYNEDPVIITDPVTEPVSEEDETSEEISSEVAEATTQETSLYTEISDIPLDGTTETEDDSGKPFTTIYLSGLSLDYTMKLKNTETKKTYEIEFNRDNNWTNIFEGPEGTYKIAGFTTNATSGKAGKVYDKSGKEIKTITIKRTEGFQVLELSVSEHVTFAIGQIFKENWLLMLVLAVLGIVYIYLRKHRILPSEER